MYSVAYAGKMSGFHHLCQLLLPDCTLSLVWSQRFYKAKMEVSSRFTVIAVPQHWFWKPVGRWVGAFKLFLIVFACLLKNELSSWMVESCHLDCLGHAISSMSNWCCVCVCCWFCAGVIFWWFHKMWDTQKLISHLDTPDILWVSLMGAVQGLHQLSCYWLQWLPPPVPVASARLHHVIGVGVVLEVLQS